MGGNGDQIEHLNGRPFLTVRLQAIYDIAALCYRQGIRHVVLCPGSRCAPLTLAFTRHPGFTVRTFSDERSAAFIALGIAQQTRNPTVLVCTSGTAVYNFAPAIAEAYYNQVPLLVFTADRPREWIGQQDGQAIYQENIFGRHIKLSLNLPQTYDHQDDQWAVNRMVNEAINLSRAEPLGPVHINAPFREPFYPVSEEIISYSENINTVIDGSPSYVMADTDQKEILRALSSFHHILILAGQCDHDEGLISILDQFVGNLPIPVVAEVTSNLHGLSQAIRHADVFLGQATNDVKQSLQPDLLITFGKSIVSKQVKLFLRKFKPKTHWHIQPAGPVADTFQSLTEIIRTSPLAFFKCLDGTGRAESFEGQKQHNYFKLWEIEERRMVRSLEQFFPKKDFGELELVNEIIQGLPGDAILHLANSMSVRYANFIGLNSHQKNVYVFSNRGTSGVDGCTSTAVGHTMASNQLNILITGDVAFFYDRNAFWHNYPLQNLRIVLLNNHGGIIFKMIDGPASLPESDEFFVTRQKLTAQKLCEEYGFEYLKLDHPRKLNNLLKDFFDKDKMTKVLELETTAELNKIIFDRFKEHIKKSYEL